MSDGSGLYFFFYLLLGPERKCSCGVQDSVHSTETVEERREGLPDIHFLQSCTQHALHSASSRPKFLSLVSSAWLTSSLSLFYLALSSGLYPPSQAGGLRDIHTLYLASTLLLVPQFCTREPLHLFPQEPACISVSGSWMGLLWPWHPLMYSACLQGSVLETHFPYGLKLVIRPHPTSLCIAFLCDILNSLPRL